MARTDPAHQGPDPAVPERQSFGPNSVFRRATDIEPVFAEPMLTAPNGTPLLVEGAFNMWWGNSSIGKSWSSPWIMDQIPDKQLVIASWELPDVTYRSRLDIMGISPDRFTIGFDPNPVDLHNTCAQLDGPVVLIDALESAGCKSDVGDITAWVNSVVNPLLALGCTVIGVDHLGRNTKDRSAPKGSTMKKQKIQGVGLLISESPRVWTDMAEGTIKLEVMKANMVGPGPAGCTIKGVPSGDMMGLALSWGGPAGAASEGAKYPDDKLRPPLYAVMDYLGLVGGKHSKTALLKSVKNPYNTRGNGGWRRELLFMAVDLGIEEGKLELDDGQVALAPDSEYDQS